MPTTWTGRSNGVRRESSTIHRGSRPFSSSFGSAKGNIRVRPELRVQVGPTRFRVPDVTVLDRNLVNEQIVTVAPLAVFEVLSPEDRVQRLNRKLEDYRMGIPQIWVIDSAEEA